LDRENLALGWEIIVSGSQKVISQPAPAGEGGAGKRSVPFFHAKAKEDHDKYDVVEK
jgi:hypothetical protein